VKDASSEHGDAASYAIGEKFPLEKLIERPKPRRPVTPRALIGASGRGQAWMAT
jgi:hypothetical protein